MPRELRIRQLFLFGWVGIASAAAVFLANSNRNATHGPSETQTQGQTAGRAPATEDPTRFSFAPRSGHRYVYSFRREILLKGLPSGDSTVAYHGEFEIDVIRGNGNGFEALARSRISEHPVRSPVTLKIDVTRAGKDLRVFNAGLSDEDERQQSAVLKDLLALWDFPLTEDTTGPYQASFQTHPPIKSKLKYLSPAATNPQIVSSEHRMKWDETISLPRELAGQETTKLGHDSITLSSTSAYEIVLLRDEALPAQTATLVARFSESDSLALESGDKNPEAARETWSEILASLQEAQGMDAKAQLDLLGKLVRYIQSHPDSASDLQNWLRSQGAIEQGLTSALFRTVVGALASAGSPAAQTAVLKIYSDPSCPLTAKGAILTALTTTQAPLSPSTQEFLAATMKNESHLDLAQGASYALGSSLSKSTEPSHLNDAIATIRQAWEATSSSTGSSQTSLRLSLLDAMGNSGQSTYLTEIRSVIDDPRADPSLKAKAVYAVRSMNDTTATQILLQSFSDPAWQVRQAAIQAVSSRDWNESFRPPLAKCASSDPVASLQSGCRSILQAADRADEHSGTIASN